MSTPEPTRSPASILRDISAFAVYAVRRFFTDRMSQAAGSLTYSTLLALVPLLVIAFAVLSNFAAFDAAKTRLEDMFLGAIVPEVGDGVGAYFAEFTANARNLTAAGTVALAVTAVFLLSTIESTFNRIWHVDRPRPLGQRVLVFWAVLTLGPLLLGLSFSITSDAFAIVDRWGAGASVIDRFEESGSAPQVLFAVLAQSLAFGLLYKVVPARPVRLADAALGGLVAGIAFQILRTGFNGFFASGSTYQTIYGAVAVFPLFLIWVYASWTVIILGAVVAAALPDWWKSRDPLLGVTMPPGRQLQVAVAVLSVLGQQARAGGGVAPEAMADRIPLDARDTAIDRLGAAGYLAVTEAGDFVLTRDLGATTLGDLIADLNLSLTAPAPSQHVEAESRSAHVLAEIDRLSGDLPTSLNRLEEAGASILSTPLADVVIASAPPAASDRHAAQ